jgi:acetyl esterase/lipase
MATNNLPPLPEPLKQVAVAGYHDGTLKDALEDYYDAAQMHAYATAAIAALAAPEGWVLVPREPTARMVDAFHAGGRLHGYDETVASGLRSAIAAAGVPTR